MPEPTLGIGLEEAGSKVANPANGPGLVIDESERVLLLRTRLPTAKSPRCGSPRAGD